MSDTNLDQTVAVVDVDSLLDGNLDDLADIPEFKNYPEGSHKVKISWEINKDVEWGGKKKKIQVMKCEAIETLELAQTKDDEGNEILPVTEGQVQIFNFDFTNEWSQGEFKLVMAGLAASMGPKSPRVLMQESQGFECAITTTLRRRKDDKTKYNVKLEGFAVA